MVEIIAVFGECKTAMAAAFQGAALHELEKAGIELWEVDGDPEALLDTILFEAEKAAQEAEKEAMLPFPVLENLGEGRYIHSTGAAASGGVVINSLDSADPLYREDLVKSLYAVGSIF